jgi:hypothetical protein
MHLAELMRDPCVEQYALGGGRLARIDVRNDTDIPVASDGSFTGHFGVLLMLDGDDVAFYGGRQDIGH